MKWSHERERDSLLTVQRTPESHLIFGPESPPRRGVQPYVRPDGFLAVNKDGLQELVHRRLFRLLMQPDLGRRKLTRVCKQWGCQNPFHYKLTSELEPRSRERCPNGHLYEGNLTVSGHCAICALERAMRREQRRESGHPTMAEKNAAKTECPHGHPYDEANTYWATARGGLHRKCRRCNAERAAERRKNSSPEMRREAARQ